jgi:NagD protein
VADSGPLRALLFDIDGVILQDETPLPGARELLEWLGASGLPFAFLTNYSSQTPADLVRRFARVDLPARPEQFYTSAMATAEFLAGQAGEKRRAFVVGDGALVHELYRAGFTLSESEADFVVLGETKAYNFEMIQRAAQLVLEGARFIATNPDVKGPRGRPSCGALATPIEKVTGRAPFYVGKPSPFMMRAALRHLKAHTDETWLVGDNMETDVIAGVQTGMTTVLVLTGVSREVDLPRYAYRATHTVEDAAELKDLLRAQAEGARSG